MRGILCFIIGVVIFNCFWYISGVEFPSERGKELLIYSGILTMSGVLGDLLFDPILPVKLKILGINFNGVRLPSF